MEKNSSYSQLPVLICKKNPSAYLTQVWIEEEATDGNIDV